jgi:hypothetical protein
LDLPEGTITRFQVIEDLGSFIRSGGFLVEAETVGA